MSVRQKKIKIKKKLKKKKSICLIAFVRSKNFKDLLTVITFVFTILVERAPLLLLPPLFCSALSLSMRRHTGLALQVSRRAPYNSLHMSATAMDVFSDELSSKPELLSSKRIDRSFLVRKWIPSTLSWPRSIWLTVLKWASESLRGCKSSPEWMEQAGFDVAGCGIASDFLVWVKFVPPVWSSCVNWLEPFLSWNG